MLYGVIQSYDNQTHTANIVTVEPSPILLQDIPVWSIFTGNQVFNVPLSAGTSGLLLFADIDVTDYLYNGNISLGFRHNTNDRYANAMFIPGFNSFVQDFRCPKDAIYIKRGNCNIKIYDDNMLLSSKSSSVDIKDKEINMKVNNNAKLNILDNGKFEIKNNTAELITELYNIIDKLVSLATTPGIWEYINTAGAVTPCTINVASVGAAMLEIEPIMAKIESLKN